MVDGLDERQTLGHRKWLRTYRPTSTNAERHAKFMARRDCALAIIVLFIELSLLYLLGDLLLFGRNWQTSSRIKCGLAS